MLDLAASEFDLVTMTRAIVGLGDPTPALLRSGRPLSEPSPGCAQVMRESLAKGCVLHLARGGWRKQDRVRKGERVSGRLWDRYPPPELEFTEASEKMLRWLAESTLVADPGSLRIKGPKGLADELVFFMAMNAAHEAHCADALARQKCFQRSALCWLAFPDYLSARAKGKKPVLPSFEPLTSGWLIEALEQELGARWVSIEKNKVNITSGAEMIRLGEAQQRVLAGYFDAISAAGRRDLARFALLAASKLLRATPSTESWLASLERTTKLSAREASRRAAGSFLVSLETLSGWADDAANAHFIDDDYAASQIYLEIWETLGRPYLATARQLAAEMSSIEGLLDEPSQGEPT